MSNEALGCVTVDMTDHDDIADLRNRLALAERRVAENARAEDALREIETRQRLLIGDWAQAEWETDADGVVVADSPSWRAYTGQTLEEWLGCGWLDAIHNDDRVHAERQWWEAIAGRRFVNAEFRLRAPGGRWRWTNVRAAPVLDQEDNIEKWVGLNIDIDVRKRAETALRESEEKYRSLFENMGQGYAEQEIVRDEAGRAVDLRLIEANPQLEALTGLPRAATVGKLFSESLPGLEPAWIERMDRVVRSGEPEQFENEVATLGRWYNVHAYPRGGDRYALLYDDITERKQAEAALRESEERQMFLLKLSDALRPMSEPEAILSEALRILGEKLEVTRTIFAERDGDEFIVTRDFVDGVPSMVGRYPKEAFGQYTSTVYDKSGRVAISDAPGDPTLSEAEKAQFNAAHIASYTATVLYKKDGISIALAAHHNLPRNWTELEFELIEETAERTWAAVERARAEAAMRASEQRLALAFSALPVGIAVIDVAGEIVMANDGMRRFLPNGKLSSRDPERGGRWRALHEDGGVVQPDHYPGARALRGETIFPGMEMTYRNDDGTEVWTEVSAVPMRNVDGSISGVISVINDVDRLKRSEGAARLSEERLSQFGEASQDILWIRDAETLQWVYLTPAFETIYGISRKEALSGDSYRNWQDLIVPEDRDHAIASIARVRDGEWVTFEFRVQRPSDGAIRWLRNTDFPITNEAGEVVLIGGVGHDMTDLKVVQSGIAASEDRLRTLMEGIPQLVWRSCDEGLWTWSSPQWQDFTGQSQQDSHSRGWLDAIHRDDHEATMHAWEEAKPHGMLDVEYRVRRASDGAWLWHHTRSVPVRDDSGRIVEWLGTTTDVHALRELQERQGVLVAELQHRTRNLITVVRSLSDRTVGNAVSLDDFRSRFARRLAALSRVQGLLSHLSAGERVDFDELLRSELTALGVADGKAERITLDGPAHVPLRSATVQTFALAVHELATNALKYGALSGSAPDGHLSVNWRVEPATNDDPPSLHVDWQERGVNMPQVGAAPRGGGYGRELIERALPYQLGAETTYELGADGVHCTIEVPISREGEQTE